MRVPEASDTENRSDYMRLRSVFLSASLDRYRFVGRNLLERPAPGVDTEHARHDGRGPHQDGGQRVARQQPAGISRGYDGADQRRHARAVQAADSTELGPRRPPEFEA